jgi:hypothetical protein
MSARNVVLVVLALAISSLAVLSWRLSGVQASAIDEGISALAEGRDARAIAAFRRAVRAHHPLADRTDDALGRLLELGGSLEERGDVELARLAYSSALGGANATTTFGSSDHALAREAETRLTRLRGGDPLPRREITARPLGKGAAGFGLILGLMAGWALLRGPGRDGERLGARRLFVAISLFFAGLSLFIVGALHA